MNDAKHGTMTVAGATDTSPADLSIAQAETRARTVWVTIIIGLLSFQVAIGITAVVLATGDPSAAIIPNYYQAAVNWDVTRRARQLTQDLQWRIERVVGEPDNATGRRPVQVVILDRKGRTVPGLNVSAKVYHHARGANIYTIMLHEAAAGVYLGETQLTQPGLWQMELQIEGEHGIAAESRELWVE